MNSFFVLTKNRIVFKISSFSGRIGIEKVMPPPKSGGYMEYPLVLAEIERSVVTLRSMETRQIKRKIGDIVGMFPFERAAIDSWARENSAFPEEKYRRQTMQTAKSLSGENFFVHESDFED